MLPSSSKPVTPNIIEIDITGTDQIEIITAVTVITEVIVTTKEVIAITTLVIAIIEIDITITMDTVTERPKGN